MRDLTGTYVLTGYSPDYCFEESDLKCKRTKIGFFRGK